MFENLQERFERAFKILKGQGRITEINVAETVKEIRRALVEADVNYKIAKEFTDKVKQKALGANVLNAISPGQLMVKITRDELAELMGSKSYDINLKGSPAIILLVGLQGSGKTTLAAKLARWIKSKKQRNPLLVACDVYRPAAIEQLKILGQSIEVPVYSEDNEKDPVKIALNAVNYAKNWGYNTIIIDTAGRQTIDEHMMNEIAKLHKSLNPSETLFVVDAMIGQDAVNTAKAFNDVLNYDGIVLTKLDSDTRGGAALSIKSVVQKPIKFISTGERIDAFDVFHPDRMADRILGMGDIVSLVEKAQEQFDAEEARKLQQKLAKDAFNFNDFLKQLNQIKKMGNIKDLLAMIPGMNKYLKDLDIDDTAFKHIEAIIYSMTPEERENPAIINGSRKKRIALGSGRTIQEVNQLLKQFEQMRQMMKILKKGGSRNFMNMIRQIR